MAPAAWYTLGDAAPERATAVTLLRSLARRQVILLGERHDNAEDHAWQLQTLASLHLLRPGLVIGFEAFPRRVQPVLDRWVAGSLTERQFLEQSEWDKVWSYPPALYMPLFEFARLNRIPMVALNVDRKLIEAVGSRGWDAVPAERKEGVSTPRPASAAYEQRLRTVFSAHAKDLPERFGSGPDDEKFRWFVQSQLTWDRAMAEALAARTRASGREVTPLVVGIMGAGHVQQGYGVPYQLRDLGVKDIASLLPVHTDTDCSELRSGYADAIFAAPGVPADAVPPPRLGIQLKSADDAIEIAAITPGSLAEKTGLQRGDRFVSVAGAPVKSMGELIAAVRTQPAGTWLPMQVKRGAETLDVVVHFPPQP